MVTGTLFLDKRRERVDNKYPVKLTIYNDGKKSGMVSRYTLQKTSGLKLIHQNSGMKISKKQRELLQLSYQRQMKKLHC